MASDLRNELEKFGRGVGDIDAVLSTLPAVKVSEPRKLKLGEDSEDPKGVVAQGTWDEVEFAVLDGTITDKQYAELYDRYAVKAKG